MVEGSKCGAVISIEAASVRYLNGAISLSRRLDTGGRQTQQAAALPLLVAMLSLAPLPARFLPPAVVSGGSEHGPDESLIGGEENRV